MNPELIDRFFAKQCSPKEAKQVAVYLKANPSVLEKYLSKDEWNQLAQNSQPEEFWNEVWQNIQQTNKQHVIGFRLKRFAVAASIVLCAGIAVYYLYPAKEKQQQRQVAVNTLPHVQHKIVLNNTQKLMHVLLEDSSVVELFPAAFIQFDKPFAKDKRDIYLEGEAKFTVAKNKRRPFTVYAGALATTALGTVFSVKKISAKNSVTVKLFEGKVVIHSTDKNLQGWKDDVYLLPGNQMEFNAVLKTMAVNNIKTIKQNVIVTPAKPQTDSVSNELVFNNSFLPQVMSRLSVYYKVKINFDSSAIDTMNFTGTISKNDSLPVILKAIGQMNNLDVIKDSSGFTISKQHP